MAAPNTQSTVLDAFGVELLSAIHKIREPVSFKAGERIFEQGSMADAFYIIDEGEVAIEAPTPERQRLRSSWACHVFFPRSNETHAFFGRSEHELARQDGDWRIARKKIVLQNDYIPGMLDIYCL